MLGRPVALHDIIDVEGFVASTLNAWVRKAAVRLDPDEREDLHLEGLAIMYKLAAEYEPHRDGYEVAGRFSGFVSYMLPKRLGDYWHSRHPEHHRVTNADGSRQWVYLKSAVSLQGLEERTPGRAERLARAPREWIPVPVSSEAPAAAA